MSRSVNAVTLIGNVGADPEVRATTAGTKVAQISLATSRTWKNAKGEAQERTEWHRLLCWNSGKGGIADVVERYVKKGDKLYVVGRIEYRQYEDKDGHTRHVAEINVREIVMLGSGRKVSQPSEHEGGAADARDNKAADWEQSGGTDDLPF